MTRILTLAVLATVLASTAQSQTLPLPVATALDALAGECTDAGGTPRTADAVKRADLNADGAEDYVLFAGWIHCENAASIYGDRQKYVAVFTGDGRGGATEVWGGATFEAKLEGEGPAAKLWVITMGESCGKPPAPDFASETFCDRALAWQPAQGRFGYEPLTKARIIQ